MTNLRIDDYAREESPLMKRLREEMASEFSEKIDRDFDHPSEGNPNKEFIDRGEAHHPAVYAIRSYTATRGNSAILEGAPEVAIVFLSDNLGRSLSLHIPMGLARGLGLNILQLTSEPSRQDDAALLEKHK